MQGPAGHFPRARRDETKDLHVCLVGGKVTGWKLEPIASGNHL